jgi:uncharacterized protein (DUF58 family)
MVEEAMRPGVLFTYVPPGGSLRGSYQGRLNRRGRYRVGPLRLSTRFPFGLVRRTITLNQCEMLTVFPRIGRLTRRWVSRQRPSFAETRRRELRRGLEGDFYGLRPWRSGDGLRRVHWRTSARLGELVVRQFEQPRSRDVVLLVELWQPEQPRQEHLESVELAVSFAATLTADLCRRAGGNVSVDVTGPPGRSVSGPASTALESDVMERLAVARAETHDRLPELLARATSRLGTDAEVILISSRFIDLDDRQRFATIRPDRLRTIRCIDASSDELFNLYQP